MFQKEIFLCSSITESDLKNMLFSILLGLPTWYVIGILIAFSNKFAKELWHYRRYKSG